MRVGMPSTKMETTLPSLPVLQLQAPNKCGGCTACCTVLGIKEIRKPDYAPCPHLSAGGCGIYENRPTECRTYECVWRSSNLPDELRPDRLGVILELHGQFVESLGAPAVVIREVWPGAADEDLSRQFTGLIAKQVGGFGYVVKADGERKALFHDSQKDLARRFYASQVKEIDWHEAERIIDFGQKQKLSRARRKRDADLKKKKRKSAEKARKRNR